MRNRALCAAVRCVCLYPRVLFHEQAQGFFAKMSRLGLPFPVNVVSVSVSVSFSGVCAGVYSPRGVVSRVE